MRAIGERPLKPWAGMLGGTYRWRSNPEDPGQLVHFTYAEGTPEATILDGEDAGLEADVREMGGQFEGPIAG